MRKYKVCIDPGHGGSDRYNRGPTGYIEADGNLKISLYLKEELLSTGKMEVLLTREKDMSLGLTERGRIAADWGADLFISEHTNATGKVPNNTIRGASVYYSVDIPQDKNLAYNIANVISDTFNVPNRGALTRASTKDTSEDYYGVIDSSQDRGVPHVLIVESLFHDNPLDEAILKNDANLRKLAKAQAKVICAFFGVEYNDSDIDTPIERITLKKGIYRSLDVVMLQQDLRDLGYTIDVDGDFGPGTETVVKQFQKDFGLSVDGVAGPNTRSTLEQAIGTIDDKDFKGYKQIRAFDCDVHVYNTNTNEFVDLDLGQKGKLEKLSKIDKPGVTETAKINGGFFNTDGSLEYLGTYIDEGTVVNRPNNAFVDFIYYKDGKTVVKKILSATEVEQVRTKAYWALAAAWGLVIDGQINLYNAGSMSISGELHPRTLIGQKKDGTFVLVVVDGRSKTSKGMTAKACARLMLMLGCYNAASLDGGGSSEMIVSDKIVNKPSDGVERSIGSAILVYKKESTIVSPIKVEPKGTPIMGTAKATADQLHSYALKQNKSPKLSTDLYSLCKMFIEEGQVEGVRGDIAFCQACKETGFFKFNGQTRPEWNNYSGLGVTGQLGPDGIPLGNKFPDARTGVRAQIQHLKAYATNEPLKNTCVDKRYNLVTKGIAPNWEDLNGRWAVPGTTYGQDILRMLESAMKEPANNPNLKKESEIDEGTIKKVFDYLMNLVKGGK